MIVLDTNVPSELARATPEPIVAAWADSYPTMELFTTAVSEAEMRYGLSMLPAGRRKSALADALARTFDTIFLGRILAFDRRAASAFADIAAASRRAGHNVGMADLQIAAISIARNAEAIATRNARDFAHCGLPVINPWKAG